MIALPRFESGLSESHVTVSLIDLVSILSDASTQHRGWLEDFAEDTIKVPQDLYEVLVAYKTMLMHAADEGESRNQRAA
jgi:hypothetical protein